MCLLASNRRAFIEWLNGRPELAASLAPKGHLPRRVYGEFLIDVMRSARTIAAIKGIRLREVGTEVTAMHERADGQVEIGWAAVLEPYRGCTDAADVKRQAGGRGARLPVEFRNHAAVLRRSVD